MIYDKLKQYLDEIKNQTDLSYQSIPFFARVVKDIRIELLKVAAAQGEQITRDVTDAMRLIHITEREDLNNIENYPREIPKYLGRVRDAVMSSLSFVNKGR